MTRLVNGVTGPTLLSIYSEIQKRVDEDCVRSSCTLGLGLARRAVACNGALTNSRKNHNHHLDGPVDGSDELVDMEHLPGFTRARNSLLDHGKP